MSLARIIRALASLFFMALFIGLPTSKGIASVGVGGLLGVSILELLKNGFPKVSRSDWQLWMPLCLLLLLIISFFRSEDTDTAWKVLYRQNTLLILPLALLVFKDIFQKQFRLFFQLFIAANSFAALLTLFFFFLPSALCIKITQQLAFLQDYIVHEKVYAFGVYSPFLDRLHFSYLLATSILLQLWFLFQPKENAMTSKIYHSIALLLNLCCLMILGGRGAQLGFLLSAAIWIYLIYRQYLQSLLVQKLGSFVATSSLVGVLLISTILIPYLAYQNIPAVQSRYQQLRWEIGTVQDGTYQNYPYEHFTSLRRLMSWKYTWQLIKEQPILGIGLGDHNAELQSLYDRD
ncbi:MAG: O-antigen ligase family protein, partial [Bacteroidota bacterium]